MYKPEFYIHEARMLGASIHPPCINKSNADNLVYHKELYFGLSYLREFEQRVLKERCANGIFYSLEDFLNRVLNSIEQVGILIRIDAF